MHANTADVGPFKKITDGIIKSKTAIDFLINCAHGLATTISTPALLNSLLAYIRRNSDADPDKPRELTFSEKFSGFLVVTKIITSVLVGLDSLESTNGAIWSTVGKVADLVGGVVGAIFSLKHLYDRITQVIAARHEYSARVARSIVNAKLSRKESMFEQCQMTAQTFELQEAQEKQVASFLSLSAAASARDREASDARAKARPVSDSLVRICKSFPRSCFMLFQSRPALQNSVKSHSNGKQVLTEVYTLANDGPVTDLAVARVGAQTKAYEQIGFELVPGAAKYPLSADGCKAANGQQKICDLMQESCTWKAAGNACEAKDASKKPAEYNVMFCRGCTNARPIRKFEVVEMDSRKETTEESYRFRRISEDKSVFMQVTRVRHAPSRKRKVLVALRGATLEPTFNNAGRNRDYGQPHRDGWWSSDLPKASATYVDSSVQMQTVQAQAKKPMCQAKAAQAKYLVEKCALHGDTPASRQHTFPVYDGANRLGTWHNCPLDKGAHCTTEKQFTNCAMGSWLLPGMPNEKIGGSDHNTVTGVLDRYIRESEVPMTLGNAKAYYNLNSKENRDKQNAHFDTLNCGYRHFIPVTFSTSAKHCAQPRLALEALDPSDIRKTGLSHTIKEICSADEAQASGSTTSMKVHPELYYIEILFKQGQKGDCLARTGADPDWFCNPSEAEVNSAFENGWSMLPFAFFGEGKQEEEHTASSENKNVAFGMRLWVRFDDRINRGNPPAGAKSERAFLEGVAEATC